MSTDHDDVRFLLGAYVLGGLDELDRRIVDTHLPTCRACRDELAQMAPLPGLLRRMPRPTVAPESLDAPVDEPVSAGLPALASPPRDVSPAPDPPVPLTRLLDQVRDIRTARRRRTRFRLLAAAAIVLVIAGAGLGFLVKGAPTPTPTTPPPPPGTVVAFTAAAGSSTAGEATFVPKQWGTSLSVSLVGLPAAGPFVLRVVGVDGRTESAATWGPTATAKAKVDGATSLHLPDLRSVTVLGQRGQVLATAYPG